MSATRRTTRQERNARLAATAAPKVNKFALLSETLLLGVCLFVLGLPLVTVPAAYAAGAAHMERHVSGRPDTIASLWTDFKAALPGSWKFGLLALGAALVAGVNLLLAGSQQLPGGRAVLFATVVLAGGLAVLLLRTAGLWQEERARSAAEPGSTADPASSAWAASWAQAKREAAGDWIGTLLLLVAMAMCLTFVWMLPPLVFIVPGALTLAVVSVRFRQRSVHG
ncbi:Poxvirus protein I5 [Arthrobacter glacialis]|uniref:Poxvirus protein I5 n=1 Tax=Arthrobacter glacialis TaxID=1664 RepID=UPI001FB0047A|nr:Poxvirus protein I5 [Arthrobacter glacialis]